MYKNFWPRLFASVFGLVITLALCACGSDNPDPKPPVWPDWAASRIFQADGKTFAPADFEEMNLSYVFDLEKKEVRGDAQILFSPSVDGHPYFLSDPEIVAAELDGNPISLTSRIDPDGLNSLRVLPTALEKGARHYLSIQFLLPASRISLREDGIGFLTSMSDIGRGNYFEAYAPSNFEFDAFRLRLNLEILGSGINSHRLFANGKVEKKSERKWSVDFPAYFTSSSFYLHLTDTPVFVRTGIYEGLERSIPIAVYSREESLADQAMSRLPRIFSELESTYGPYAHESFTAYISGKGGMEHAGATVTSLSALAHELTHSWFARGVMPSDGRSGWIDEAIASWRDNGYFRATHQFARAPTNLGRASAFQRFTPRNSYVDGRLLLSELDLLFAANGGLRPLLKDFFDSWKRRAVTTADFREFLEEKSGISLVSHFQTYVFGADAGFPGDGEVAQDYHQGSHRHPPPLSPRELDWLR